MSAEAPKVDFDTRVKMAIYRHFADTTQPPGVLAIARAVDTAPEEVRDAYTRLAEKRVLVLERDGQSIRMAPPFSGVPTPHTVEIGPRRYHPNCAWDALGILAALRARGVVHSQCAESRTPLRLEVDVDGVIDSGWRFHCAVPASRWWSDIVYT